MSSALVGISPTPVEVPPVVHILAGRLRPGTTVVPVWRNEYGGFTARLEDPRTASGAATSRTAPDPFPGSRYSSGQRLQNQHSGGRRLRSPRPGHRYAKCSYLKWVPRSSSCPDPVAEADRLIWAGTFTAVPRVLDVGRDAHGAWLLTEAVEAGDAIATSAIEPRWRILAQRSAIAIGMGLRRFHDALPTDTCPFIRTAELRVAALRGVGLGPAVAPAASTVPAASAAPAASASGITSPAVISGVSTVPAHRGNPPPEPAASASPATFSTSSASAAPRVSSASSAPSASSASGAPSAPGVPSAPTGQDRGRFPAALADPPPVDRLVVCHGDATVPNTLLDGAGRFAAHVDVGDLGVADRWSDIAVTTRSVTRRYGPGLEPLVLAAYGVAPDPDRTAYYRALWDAEEAVRVRRAERPRRRTGPQHHLRRAS
ncbi:phosphotransferase [Promicromonospora sukumoe]|uniref:phosphotransferase n=1 Tax=Promicromonospora sukumoe TaxID=88382 RepID=UPI0012F96204